MKPDQFPIKKKLVYFIATISTLMLFSGCSKCGLCKGDEWVSLFDGETLDGWMVKCLPKDVEKEYWKVVDGSITLEVPKGSDHKYIWLLTEKEYDNFELELKVQSFADTKSNSGVQVRSRYDDAEGWLDGPQVDVHPSGGWRSGFIYDETRTVKEWLSPIQGKPSVATIEDAISGWNWKHGDEEDVWNYVRIVCVNTRIMTVVNGVTITDFDGSGVLDDADHAKLNVGMNGHIGLQIHPGGEGKIRFKDLQIKELKSK